MCLIVKLRRVMSFLSVLGFVKKTTMPSTAVTVAGTAAHVFLSNNVVQSRLSTRFVQTHIPRKSRSSVVEMVVSTRFMWSWVMREPE